MNQQNIKQNLVRSIAILAVILPTTLLQAESSQAIPLDEIFDSAGKTFVQKLFGIPAEKPAEPQQPAAKNENSDAPAPEPAPEVSSSNDTDVGNKE